ncbi:uncharacterized protein LOC127720431 [Mytilus californianus]|uniref:uncharacterized protein LOC127720431 n=1 Tax=Mytilus californianus TaxID=6549 RepID=UPI002247A39D|nr:uncharacterized protein LOC127720431 [Mytilus californianus]
MDESLVKEETPLCDACDRDKCTVFADFWCRECVENLCAPCVVVHQKLKMTSEHYVLPLCIKKIISTHILEIPVTCSKHSNQSVLFYCSEHKSVLCNLCKQEHQNICRELEEIKGKTDSDSFIGNFENKAEQVTESLDERIEESTKNKNCMQAEYNNIQDEIRHFCQEIKNKIDALQNRLVENLSHHHSKRIKKEDDNIETLHKVQSSVKSIEHDIKNVRDHLTKKQHFVILVALEHELQKKMDALSRLPTDEDRIQLRFQRSNLLDLITDLGTISSTQVSTCSSSNQTLSVDVIAHEDRRLQNDEIFATNILPESEITLMRETAFSQARVETGMHDLNDKFDTDCQSDGNETVLYQKESLDFELDTDNIPGPSDLFGECSITIGANGITNGHALENIANLEQDEVLDNTNAKRKKYIHLKQSVQIKKMLNEDFVITDLCCFFGKDKIALGDSKNQRIFICEQSGKLLKSFESIKIQDMAKSPISESFIFVSIKDKGILRLENGEEGYHFSKYFENNKVSDLASYGDKLAVRIGKKAINILNCGENCGILQCKKVTVSVPPEHFDCDAQGNIVQTSQTSDYVLAYGLDGTTIYRFQNSDLRNAQGLTVDSNRNTYVCGYESNTVVKISPDGKSHQVVLGEDDGIMQPYDLDYNKSTQELMIINDDHKSINIYKL